MVKNIAPTGKDDRKVARGIDIVADMLGILTAGMSESATKRKFYAVFQLELKNKQDTQRHTTNYIHIGNLKSLQRLQHHNTREMTSKAILR